MATLIASAKLTNAFRIRVVDKNVSAAITTTATLAAVVRRTRRIVSDLESTSSLANTMRYATKGGKGVFAVTSSLVCEFPTYIEIDIEALMLQGLPEGTDCVLNFQEGWMLEDRGRQLPSGAFEYASNTQNAPSPEFPSFVTFRTPKFFRSAFSSVFSIPNTVSRRRPFSSGVSIVSTLSALGIFNPGKFAALFGGVFLTTPTARKTARTGATLYNSFGPEDGAGGSVLATILKIKQLASVFPNGVATLTEASQVFNTPGPVTMSSTSTLTASVDRNIGPIIAIVSSSGTMTTTAIKVARSTPAITAQASVSVDVIAQKGLPVTNLVMTASLSVSADVPMVLTSTVIAGDLQVRLPIYFGTTNCTIDWGDGTGIQTVTSPIAPATFGGPGGFGGITHTYASAGTRTIFIKGTVTHWGLDNVDKLFSGYNEISGRRTLTIGKNYTLQGFGDIGLVSLVGYCFGTNHSNGHPIPSSIPSTVTDLSAFFAFADYEEISPRLNSNDFNRIANWNTANVQNMSFMFRLARAQPAGGYPVAGWNTQNVSNFKAMFANAGGDAATFVNIGVWNTASATNMDGMFRSSFISRDLSGWCVPLIPSLPSEFGGASVYPIWGTCP